MKYVIKLISTDNIYNNQYMHKFGGFTECKYNDALFFTDSEIAQEELESRNKFLIGNNYNHRYVLEEVEE